jgi:hypothetical protein
VSEWNHSPGLNTNCYLGIIRSKKVDKGSHMPESFDALSCHSCKNSRAVFQIRDRTTQRKAGRDKRWKKDGSGDRGWYTCIIPGPRME